MTTRLVIDSDTASDDCFALLVGLLDPEASLQAVTIVAGNVDFDQQVRNALITIEAAGRGGEVPVFAGCRRPLVRRREGSEYVHGNGMGGHDFDPPRQEPEPEHAVDALLRLADAYAGELTVICIGPLTNIAVAVAKDPAFPLKLRSLWVMGGTNNGRGNMIPAAEFNFYVDPEAARAVFRAGFDIHVVTWNLTVQQARFSREMLQRIDVLGTPLSRFFAAVNRTSLEYNERAGIAGSTHPDSLTTTLLLHPELICRQARYFIDVETQGELTRGYSVFDWGLPDPWGGPARAPNATVIEEIDSAGFYEAMVRLLSVPAAGHVR